MPKSTISPRKSASPPGKTNLRTRKRDEVVVPPVIGPKKGPVEAMATVGELADAHDKKASLAEIEKETVDRNSRSDSPDVQLVTAHFAHVYSRAVEVIGDADKATRWLGRPIPALNYATPISLLPNKKGREAVLDVLGRLEHGVF